MNNGGTVTWYFNADTGEFEKATTKVRDKAKQTGKEVDQSLSSYFQNATKNAANSLNSLADSLGGLLKTGVVALAGMGVSLGAFVKTASELETTNKQMAVLIGNTEDAQRVFGELYNYTLGKPITFPDASKAAKTLIGYGRTQATVMEDMKTLSTLSIVNGADLQALSLVFGQITSRGALFGQDALQLINNNIPLTTILAKKFGITMEQASDRINGGKVSAEEFVDAMKQYAESLDITQMSNTFENRMISLRGSIRSMGLALLGIKIDPLKGLVIESGGLFDTLSSSLAEFVGWLKTPEVKQGMAKFGADLAKGLKEAMPVLKNVFLWVLNNFPLIINVIKGVTIAWVGLKTAALALNIISGTIALFRTLAGVMGLLTKATAPMSKTAGKTGVAFGNLIAGVFKPLGNPAVLKGVVAAAGIGIALTLIAFGISQVAKMEFNLANMAILLATVTVVALIFALLGTFAAYTAVGAIATALIGGALAAAAWGISYASTESKNIDFAGIMKLAGTIAVVAGILAAISALAVFGAIGAIASAVIGGGLLIAAISLAQVGKYTKKIKTSEIAGLAVTIGITSAILASISALAVFGAVGAVASAIIGGGLLLTALSLQQVSKLSKNINNDNIIKFSGTIALVSLILSAISLFSVFAAVASIATSIIGGGLLLTTLSLVKVSELVPSIKDKEIIKLSATIAIVTTILAAIALLSPFAAIGSLITSVITGGVLLAAIQLRAASQVASELTPKNLDKLEEMLKKIAGWETGGILNNLKNMVNSTILTATATMVKTIAYQIATTPIVSSRAIDAIKKNLENFASLQTGGVISNLSNMINSNILAKTAENVNKITSTLADAKSVPTSAIDSLKDNIKSLAELETKGVLKSIGDMWASGNLQKVAENVKKIINDLSGLRPPNTEAVDKLKAVIKNLSTIEISGGGWFENKGGKAEELAGIVRNIRNIADSLAGMPVIDYNKVVGVISAIKLFDRIDDNARKGVMRLKEMGDSLSNLNWIKQIFGDVPADIWNKGLQLISAIKLFDRIDDNARNGAMRLVSMKDSLGNIDWIKKIFGDVPADLATKAKLLVDSINSLGGINVDTSKLRSLGLDLVNNFINGLKSGIGSVGDVGRSLQGALWNAIQGKMQDEYYQGAAMAGKFAEGLRSKNNDIGSAGRGMQGALWNAIQPKMQDQYWQGAAMAGKFVDGLKSKNGEFSGAGSNAVQGFINGANSKNVYSVGWQIASSFLQGLKDKGKQASPWKTTMESGRFAAQGLAEGINQEASNVVKAADALAGSVIDSFGAVNDTSFTSDVMSSNGLGGLVGNGAVDNSGHIENTIGQITIGNEVDAESWLQKLTRQDQVIQSGLIA